ncbi:MAG TPA: hypothetical protein DC047_10320, partial [Blastocatellia bacterium]|nr:hypothetical protein [Blastocatellia bacterium]
RDLLGVFAVAAGDRNNVRVFAVFETGNLRRARKARSDDTDADSFFRTQETTSFYRDTTVASLIAIETSIFVGR